MDPKDKCLVLWKERHFKNLETAISAVRMLYVNKARPSCFLKALLSHGLPIPKSSALSVLGPRAGALGQC